MKLSLTLSMCALAVLLVAAESAVAPAPAPKADDVKLTNITLKKKDSSIKVNLSQFKTVDDLIKYIKGWNAESVVIAVKGETPKTYDAAILLKELAVLNSIHQVPGQLGFTIFDFMCYQSPACMIWRLITGKTVP